MTKYDVSIRHSRRVRAFRNDMENDAFGNIALIARTEKFNNQSF